METTKNLRELISSFIKVNMQKSISQKIWLMERYAMLLYWNLPKWSTILYEIPANFFVEIEKLIPKFIQKYKNPRIAKTILQKKKKVKKTHIFQFQNLLQSYNN